MKGCGRALRENAKRIEPMWDYPPKTAVVRCLYLSFYELFEKSGHGTLCQNIALSKFERRQRPFSRGDFSVEVIFTVNIGSKFWEFDE